jgi:hypothetical protein
MNRLVWIALWMLVLLGMLAACEEPQSIGQGDLSITVSVDGERLVYRYDKRVSVGQFLNEIGVTLGEFDEVNPLLQTQVRDGMTITVTRVVQLQECENSDIPPGTERQLTQSLPPGEERIAQTGENGIIQICYRVTMKDGVQTSRVEASRIVVKEPRNEIVYVGSEPPETLVPIDGVLAFISGGQAWIIEGNTANLNPLTQGGYLDGRVFDLSADGKRLLYTRRTADPADPDFANELWAVLDTTAPFPRAVQLAPSDVRYAQWVPGETGPAFSYSTASPATDGPGWRAYNDLYLMQIDPVTGEALAEGFREIVSANALGIYAYWGRRFAWSPDGAQVAWANADSVGVVNLETGEFETLLTFPEYRPLLERFSGASVWIPTLSWSEDGYLTTTAHGPPYADEAPQDSIIFDVAVINPATGLEINPFLARSGIWSSPAYSPLAEGSGGAPEYAIAYFQAREPLNSPGAHYDLVVADRDGSNARAIFPGAERPGLRPDPEDGIAWSPAGRQIALIYQGNLWLIDVKTAQAYQITSDGQASRPRWSRLR